MRPILPALAALALFFGCASPATRSVTPNPLVLNGGDFETVWTRTVRVLDDYFDIETENRLARRIETRPKIGATLLEPWDGDSVGAEARLEATLQPIRRFAIANVQPTATGGWSVKVEVYKELEDLAGVATSTAPGLDLENEFLLHPTPEFTLSPTDGQKDQWVPRGRDTKLEQVILYRIRQALFL